MTEPSTDPRIERARRLYVQGDLSIRLIAESIGIAIPTLTRWRKQFDWPMRGSCIVRRIDPPPDGADGSSGDAEALPKRGRRKPAKQRKRPTVPQLVDRLYVVITHTLEQMEKRMSEGDGTPAGDNPERDTNPERDMRAVGNIVRSVEKLREIQTDNSKRDTASTGNGRYPLSPGEEDRLRLEIVERLLKLRERRANSGGSGPSAA